MCAGSFVRRGCELMNYGNCLSLRGGLIIRKHAIGVAILANVLGTVRTKLIATRAVGRSNSFARFSIDTWTDRLLTGGSRSIGAAIAKLVSALPFESRSSVANMRPPEMRTNTPTFAYVLSNE